MSFKKKYFFLLFLIFFLVPISSGIETFMNSTVALKENIFLSVATDKSSYCEPEIVNITTTLENRGNYGASGNLTIKIIDSYENEIKNETWETSVNGGETKNFFSNYTVESSSPEGIYTVKSNFSYNKEFKYAETEFRVKKGIGTLVVSPLKIEKTMKPGDSSNETIYLWLLYPCYGTYASLNKSSGEPGDWLSLSNSTVYLPETSEAKSVTVSIKVPRDAKTGNYTGYISVKAGDQQKTITVKIYVNASGIFDLSVSIPSEKKEVCQGDSVYAIVTITKFSPSGITDINMTYMITNHLNEYIDKKNETIAIDTTMQRTPSLHVPSDLSPGYYTFVATLEYKEIQISSTDIFRVKECLVAPPSGAYVPLPPVQVEKLILNVSPIILVTIPGNETGFVASVENLGTKSEVVEVVVEGIPSNWISITPSRTEIKPNETQNFIALIKIPKEIEEKIYYLKVTAFDGVKSNTENVTLIIGKDWKSAADLVLAELEKIREEANKIFFLECLNINEIKKIFENGEHVREIGMEEYENNNYEKAIDFFIYAISLYEKTVNRAHALIQLEATRIEVFSFIPFEEEINYHLRILRDYAREKNFERFCEPYVKIQQLSKYSKIVFGLVLVAIAIILTVISYVLIKEYKKRKEKRIEETFEEIKRRLKKILESE